MENRNGALSVAGRRYAVTEALEGERRLQEDREQLHLDIIDRDILRAVKGSGSVTAYGRRRLARLIALGFVQARGHWERRPLDLTSSGLIALDVLEAFLVGDATSVPVCVITQGQRITKRSDSGDE